MVLFFTRRRYFSSTLIDIYERIIDDNHVTMVKTGDIMGYNRLS